jgi:hypothetical protein
MYLLAECGVFCLYDPVATSQTTLWLPAKTLRKLGLI